MTEENMRKMNLIIVGALPPPRGGVTTHAERLIPYLEEAGIGYVVWDYSRQTKAGKHVVSLCRQPLEVLRSLFRLKGVKVSHCLISSVSFVRMLFCFFLKIAGIRVTITFVGSPKEMIGKSSLKQFYILTLARLARHVIAVNRDFRKILVEQGIPENKISIIPAFIPSRDNDFITRPIPRDIVEFCQGGKPLILGYGYGPLFHANEDLYGLDLIVGLAKKLKADFTRARFVVVIPEITNEKYFEQLKNDIRQSNIDSSFRFAIGNHLAFVPFLQYADLFIRTTNTDGDALTLREALYYGVPSVASDVCYRPESTILFRSRDITDLYRVVRQTLNNDASVCNKTEASKVNNANLFIDIFKRIAETGEVSGEKI
ncbi:MAG: glycosyltransferase [Candidatus Omnitrophota bacterium]